MISTPLFNFNFFFNGIKVELNLEQIRVENGNEESINFKDEKDLKS